MINRIPLLTENDQSLLCDALYYMKMDELRRACSTLMLPDKGKKVELINRIMLFIQTRQITQTIKMPPQSVAKSYPLQPLSPASYMLYGSYKNDAKSREFFKKLIGSHFHFTAFGIDWLNDCWQRGCPPTYQEFADYWIKEMQWRKEHKSAPKQEWAFIRFLQRMQKEEPQASQEDLMHAWKELQAQKVETATALLKKAGVIIENDLT